VCGAVVSRCTDDSICDSPQGFQFKICQLLNPHAVLLCKVQSAAASVRFNSFQHQGGGASIQSLGALVLSVRADTHIAIDIGKSGWRGAKRRLSFG